MQPEVGYSFDAGVEVHAADRTAWRASVDFFRTDLRRFIEVNDDASILDECATRGSPSACSKISRFDDGSLKSVNIENSNFGHFRVQGIDLAASLEMPIRAGTLSLRAFATRLVTHDVQVFEGGETFDDLDNFFGFAVPKWRALGTVAFRRGNWSAGYAVQWIGRMHYCVDRADYCGAIPQALYHDIETSYRTKIGLALKLGVNNITDADPPFISDSSANTDVATYRLLGRTYFAQLTFAFH